MDTIAVNGLKWAKENWEEIQKFLRGERDTYPVNPLRYVLEKERKQ